MALRHGVLILPGTAMSATEQHARLSGCRSWRKMRRLRAGVRRLSAAWRDYKSGGAARPAAERRHGVMVR